MSKDMIADFLTVIRNGIMASKLHVLAPYSNMRQAIANLLKEEGFIRDVVVQQDDESGRKQIKIMLKYVKGESVIHEISRISKPSRRCYAGAKNIKPVIGGLGVSIVTTSNGVITHKKAKKMGVGGEVICTVW